MTLPRGDRVCAIEATLSRFIDGRTMAFALRKSGAAHVSVGSLPPLWIMPTMFLSGPAAPTGIATINSIGNLGGFAGPAMIGWIKDWTGSFEGGLFFVGACWCSRPF